MREQVRASLLRADLEYVLAEREPGRAQHLFTRESFETGHVDFARGKALGAAHVLLEQASARDRTGGDGDQHEPARDPRERAFAALERRAHATAAASQARAQTHP